MKQLRVFSFIFSFVLFISAFSVVEAMGPPCPAGAWLVGGTTCYCRQGCSSNGSTVPARYNIPPYSFLVTQALNLLQNRGWGGEEPYTGTTYATQLSCVFPSSMSPPSPLGFKVGCIYKEALNYDATATIPAGSKDPGACIFPTMACVPGPC